MKQIQTGERPGVAVHHEVSVGPAIEVSGIVHIYRDDNPMAAVRAERPIYAEHTHLLVRRQLPGAEADDHYLFLDEQGFMDLAGMMIQAGFGIVRSQFTEPPDAAAAAAYHNRHETPDTASSLAGMMGWVLLTNATVERE